jgi:Flp pilus assembly pilin Flp
MRFDFLGNEDGVSMIEWTLISTLIAGACITSLSLIGIYTDETFNFILTVL